MAAPYGIFRLYVKYCLERVTVPDLAAELTRQIMVPGRTRGLDHPAAIAVTRIRSFAKDIDTRPELEEILRDGLADRGQGRCAGGDFREPLVEERRALDARAGVRRGAVESRSAATEMPGVASISPVWPMNQRSNPRPVASG